MLEFLREESTMKKCYVCKTEFPYDMFGKNISKLDGHADECKSCKSETDKIYRKANKNKIRLSKHRHYLENKDAIIAKVNEYIKNNRAKHNVWGTKAKNKLKTEVLIHYCNGDLKCRLCPESELGLLTIDHVDGNGAEHRREIGLVGRGGYPMYQWLKKNGYPKGFQTLCFNCNFRKRAIELKPENPTHLQIVRAAYARLVKVECLENYGGLRCSCGEADLDVLTLDHVNDDGAEHRRKTGKFGNNFYHMLRKNSFPKDPPLQVLCLNCQTKKKNEKYQLDAKTSNKHYYLGGSFGNESGRYSVDVVNRYAKRFGYETIMSTEQLYSMIEGHKTDEEFGSPEFLVRSEKTDLRAPILIHDSEECGMYIADGLHRISKAKRNEVKELPVRIVRHLPLSARIKE